MLKKIGRIHGPWIEFFYACVHYQDVVSLVCKFLTCFKGIFGQENSH